MTQILGAVFFSLFGLACIGLGAWHEIMWMRRRRWPQVQATVIGAVENAEEMTWAREVEYTDGRGEVCRFTSIYGSSARPTPGESVRIAFDPGTGKAEVISGINRILWTVIPLLFGVIFLWVGLFVP